MAFSFHLCIKFGFILEGTSAINEYALTVTMATSHAPCQQWLWTISGEYFNICQRFDNCWLFPQHSLQWVRVHWKCSQVLFAHDLPQNWGKHYLISTGKTLTQDKLADCKVHHMIVLWVTADINSVRAAEASQGPGTNVWIFLEGQSSCNLFLSCFCLLERIRGNRTKW